MIIEKHPNTEPLFVTNPRQWLENVTRRHEYVCIVIFRGHWCEYDRHYLTLLGKQQIESMAQNDVHLIAWTSEGQDGANKADKDWELTSKFKYAEVIGDNTCALANFLIQDDILPTLKVTSVGEAHVEDETAETSYPCGIAQPGMVFYAHHGNLVLHWEAEVKTPFYGATDRPLPSEVWRKVQKRKHALDLGNAVMPVSGTNLKKCINSLDASLLQCGDQEQN